jgi:hypothetical protein
MTSRALIITASLLSTAAWAACRNVGSGDDAHDASTDTNSDTDGLTRVYGDLSGGTGYCCGESLSEDPVHISLSKLTDACDTVASPTTFEGDFYMGDGYELILDEGGCYALWAIDASSFYCSADVEGPIVVADGESYLYGIELYCCCDED